MCDTAGLGSGWTFRKEIAVTKEDLCKQNGPKAQPAPLNINATDCKPVRAGGKHVAHVYRFGISHLGLGLIVG